MNEEQFETQLNAWVDGELSAAEAEAFEATLAEHPEFAAEAEAMQGILQDAQALPKHIQPERNLWSGIEERIIENPLETQGSPSILNVVPFRAVVGLAAAVLIGISVYYQTLPQQPGGSEGGAMTPDPVAAGSLALRKADTEYQKARSALLAGIDEREAPLSDETMAVLDENLALIDGAVDEIRNAILEDPNNPRLLDMFMATRSKELALLEDMVRLPDGV